MSTNTRVNQSYRKKTVYRMEAANSVNDEMPVRTVANQLKASEKDLISIIHTSQVNTTPSSWSMPPLVRAYRKGRDNDPL